MSVFGMSAGAPGSGGTISNGQAALIAIGAVLSITVFVLPGPSVIEAGNDGYWSPVLATLPSLVQLGLFCWLARRHGWASPYQYLPTLLGPWPGRLACLLYAGLFFFVAASVSQLAVKVLGAVFMPLTPPAVLAVTGSIAAGYAAWLGIEAFGRLAQLLMPLLLGVMALLPLAVAGQSDPGQILPILHQGWAGPWRGTAVPMAMRGEAVLLLAFLVPHLRRPKHAFRVGTLASCAIAIFLAANAMMLISLFSPAEVTRMSMPVVSAARQVQLARGIENIEFLVIGPWMIALVLKVAIFIYFGAIGLACAFKTNWRPLVLPASLAVSALGSWMYPNAQVLKHTISNIWPGYSVTMILLLPAVLCLVAWLRGPASAAGGRGRRRLGLVVLCLLALSGGVSGCWDRKELDELTRVIGGYLDLEPGGELRLTVETMFLGGEAGAGRPGGAAGAGGAAGGGGAGGMAPGVFSVTGRGFQEAIHNLRWVTEYPPSASHLGFLVLGEEVARMGLGGILDALSLDYQVRRTILLAVTPGRAAGLLEAGPAARRHADHLLGLLRLSERGSGDASRITLNHVLTDLGTPGTDPVLARVVLEPPPGGGPDDAPPGGAPRLALDGAGLFRADRLVAMAERPEALGISLVRAPVRNLVLWIPAGDGDREFAVNLVRSSPWIRIREDGDRLVIQCGAQLETDVLEFPAAGEIATPQALDDLAQQVSRHMESLIAAGLAYAAELGVDPPGFGRYLSRHHPRLWERHRDRWPEAVRQAQVTVSVETVIISSGMHSRSRPAVPARRAPPR